MITLNVRPGSINRTHAQMTKWASQREKAVAKANYRTAMDVSNDAKARFQKSEKLNKPRWITVNGRSFPIRYEIGEERDAQGRLLPHVRHGFLRKSIRPLRGEGTRAYVEAGTGESATYAEHVEFGSKDGRHPRPHPYLFPAAEGNRRRHREEVAHAYRTRVAI